MGGSIVRVLLVDDSEPWRRFVATMFQARPELQIISQASDGLGAVREAERLQPDLILLDLGLPKLNGIEAARRIRDIAPQSKILLLSENRSADILQEALGTGASGYVLKSDVGRELFAAIDIVLQGKQFVSASFGTRNFPDFERQHIGEARKPEKVIAPFPPRNVPIRHEVAFYSDDAAFVDGFARTIKTVIKIGNPVILVATEPHRAHILRRLREDGAEVDAAIRKGRYFEFDAPDALSKIMVHGFPDPALCTEVVRDLVNEAKKGSNGEPRRVAICGECAPTLIAQGNTEGAIRLEHLWDQVTRSYDADTLCGYLLAGLPGKDTGLVFQSICAEHSAVYGRALGY